MSLQAPDRQNPAIAGNHLLAITAQTPPMRRQVGADMAMQFMLMTLFQMVSEMADDPRALRSDVHKELRDLVATYKLPPMPEDGPRKVRASAAKIVDGIMLRSFERSLPKDVW